MKMTKVFIAHPTIGLEPEQVFQDRHRCRIWLERHYDTQCLPCKGVRILDNYDPALDFEDVVKHPRIAYISHALRLLAEADVILMAKGWQQDYCCVTEYDVAKAYGLKILEEQPLFETVSKDEDDFDDDLDDIGEEEGDWEDDEWDFDFDDDDNDDFAKCVLKKDACGLY